MTAREILLAAARRIDEKGLYRCHYNGNQDFKHLRTKSEAESTGPCDATMSLRAVGLDHPQAVDQAKELLRAEIGGGSISWWSDEHTAEEVAGTMRKVAKKAARPDDPPSLDEVAF